MKTQIIKAGHHYTRLQDRRFGFAPKKFECRIIVDKSWWYPKENDDSKDVNKIFGKSIGWHVMDSVRLGWIPNFENKGIIKLYWYVTTNFEDSKDSLFICHLLPFDEIILKVNENNFQLDYPFIPRMSSFYTHPKNLPGYWLNPYFGGDNKSPHDIITKSEIINR